jgi:flavin reductase (DIM6/NTAB) family NADH-FMN oxidoreductase RutF
VAASPAALECTVVEIVALRGRSNVLVIGEVTGIHIDPALIRDGRFDTLGARLVARLGYRDYGILDRSFELARPGEG